MIKYYLLIIIFIYSFHYWIVYQNYTCKKKRLDLFSNVRQLCFFLKELFNIEKERSTGAMVNVRDKIYKTVSLNLSIPRILNQHL